MAPVFYSRAAFDLRSFARDTRGSTAVIFAISIIPLCLSIGMAVDYSRAHALKTALQSAADQAALAAVASTANGNSTDTATTAGQTLWAANAAKILSTNNSIPAPTITTQNVNGVATTLVTFSGTQQTAFASVMGMTTIPATGSSTAQAYQTITKSNGVNGTGSTWGDPHINGGDGASFTFHCPAGNWYSLLSDSGVEVNIACVHEAAAGEDVINQFSVVLGGHQIGYAIPAWDDAYNPVAPFNPGVVTIDGVAQTTARGSTASYLGGAVSFNYTTSDWQGYGANVVTVTTPQYKISLTLQPGNGVATVTATGAGLCGTPGGIWGKTLSGLDDSSGSDFQVAGPTATTNEFSRSGCTIATLGPHLIH